MKKFLLLVFVAASFLPACASVRHRNEVEVEVPPHDAVVRDEIPAEGQRKIPVVRKYSP